ncbi:uncharacterized protein LOC122864139 isoform X9 [Xyrichtys novacula]|uniref:Uncharacterized protein LOC122864139 isoform X9 n=1 Tax=Xyrichtys novacula TaxID=13765 RepID=A0AAV1HCQ6_XYRNO|nr:uncharacterized protein LOC122864139 isoform X9 [Xyrichtys novacula]
MNVTNKRDKMMRPRDPKMKTTPRQFPGAFAPLPRSTWISSLVPYDDFDRVCHIIWKRTKEAEEGRSRGQSSPESLLKKDCKVKENKPGHRSEEQQKKTDDLGPYTQYEEDKQQNTTGFILPCPYLSGHRHVAKPSRMPGLEMEGQMKQFKGEERGQRNLENLGDKPPPLKTLVPQFSNRTPKKSSTPECEPPAKNLAPSAPEHNSPNLQKKKRPPLLLKPARHTCESEDELSVRSSSDSNSSDDDDSVTLPGARTCASDSSGDDSARDNNDCEEEHSSDELCFDSGQDSPSSSTEQRFPPLPTTKVGVQPCPTKPRASGKMRGLWEIPLSFAPTATLANSMTTHAQARVQSRAEALEANLKTKLPPAAPAQQEAYDLLADFPALGPPMKPLVMGGSHDGYPKAKDAKEKRGITNIPNHRQESGASHQRRRENIPHKVSPICAGVLKSVPDLQAFGSTRQCSSSNIGCEEKTAKNPATQKVAGTDGVGGNARSWVSAAKAGTKQAAAPQEKARPCTFQQRVTINRAKAKNTTSQNFANNTALSHHAVRPGMNAVFHGPRYSNPNQFVKPANK